MDRPGDELLPGPGLSLNENRHLGGNDPLQELDHPKHLGASAHQEPVPRLLFQRPAEVEVFDLQPVLRVLQLLVKARVLQGDRHLGREALEDRDVFRREFVRDRVGVDVENAQDPAGVQDRQRDDCAERELADALPILEEGGADRVGHPDRLPAMRRFLGDAPRDLELLGRERRLVAAASDLEMELPVLAHQHEKTAIGAGDLDDGIDDADQKLVEIERSADLTAGLEDVVDALEVRGRARARGRAGLCEELPLPLGEPSAQPLQWIQLRQIRHCRILVTEWIRRLSHGVLASLSDQRSSDSTPLEPRPRDYTTVKSLCQMSN